MMPQFAPGPNGVLPVMPPRQDRHENLYGWRFWRVSARPSLYKHRWLLALNGIPWETNGWHAARCLYAHHTAPGSVHRGGCGCGLWSFNAPEPAWADIGQAYTLDMVFGRVLLAGVTRFHTLGYRSQYALITDLWADPHTLRKVTRIVDGPNLYRLPVRERRWSAAWRLLHPACPTTETGLFACKQTVRGY